ncbi:QWRF motif-containing protein 2-like [Rutidosis leptorrhynchoides]|uniref:QWRF motif-containing protein 2-like n=1 Tax=Rutidosis leptorrhynchoides TaxID=125765 RepID=UPI003A991777
MMVANMSSTAKPKVASRAPSPARPKRAPLLPSEPDNNGNSSLLLPRRPKARDVSSRYLSSTVSSSSVSTTMTSTSSSSSFSSTTTTSSLNSLCTPRRRFPSPLDSKTNLMTPTPSLTMNNRRAQSSERRRPGTSRRGDVSAAAKMLSSTPARSLSASFQGESFAVPASKAVRPLPNNYGSRNSTPERRPVTPVVRNLGNPKTVDQQRWPARSRQGSLMTRSVDFTNENMKLSGSGTATAVRALQKSMMTETNLKPNKPEILEDNRSVDKLVSDCNNSDRSFSDAESVSSGSTIRGASPRAIVVPARYRQETVNRLRRVQPEPVSPPLSRNGKPFSGNRYLNGPAQSPRGLSPSPVRGAVRPASPSKSGLFPSALSLSRGMASPTRTRNTIGCNSNLGNIPSILSFADETRRRKVGDNAIDDAHVLRLLHNKYLQWRFVNARAEAAMSVQRATAQKSLYNSWVTTTKMRESVISKRIEIQQLRQTLKLHTVLQNQIPYLKVWDQVEREHIVSLSGTSVSLESSTLRLPLVDGAKADLRSLKDAIISSADVMQTMASLIRSLVMKVEHVNALASELASTSTKERSSIDQCKDLLSILTHLEVQECSLRAHILQLQRLPLTTITEL